MHIRAVGLAMIVTLLVSGIAFTARRPAAAAEVCFPETTRKCVSGQFYDYWLANGGLAQQGLPLSDEFNEINPTDGKLYRTQYFERARFEYHPENRGTPFEVLLGQVGREQFLAKYPSEQGGPPVPADPGQECATFEQTGRTVCGPFLAYWRANGGLAQQGLPLTAAFNEINPTDGQIYLTQYFERARFEYHPEHRGTPFEVLLGLLGREQFLARYPTGNTNFLFQDDFSNPDTGWSRIDDRDGFLGYVNGGYRIFIAPAGRLQFVFNGVDHTDMRVEVDATRIGGPDDNAYGLACRVRDSDNFYFAVIGSDDFYAIAKLRNDQLTVLDRGLQSGGIIRRGSGTNRIRFDCVGSTMTLYVNGRKLAEGRDSDIVVGRIGLVAASFNERGVDILFDNLSVLSPDGAATPSPSPTATPSPTPRPATPTPAPTPASSPAPSSPGGGGVAPIAPSTYPSSPLKGNTGDTGE